MTQSEQETPTTPRPTSPTIPAQSTPESIQNPVESVRDDESDAVFVATAEPSSDEQSASIESTSEVDWSRVRTRAETVVSDGDDEDSETYRSGEEDSFNMMTPSQSLGLQSVPSRTTATSGSVMSLEDAQSSIDAFFTNRQKYTSNQSNKLQFWQALCVEFGLVDMSSNPLPEFSDLEIITEDSETVSIVSDLSGSTMSSISLRLSQMSHPISSGPSASSKSKKKGKKNKNLPPLPTSLKQARQLLATKAHVNLKDYMAARNKARGGSKKGKHSKGPAENFAYLVYPSRRALIEYTIDTGNFVNKKKAKNEWLAPMLEQMF